MTLYYCKNTLSHPQTYLFREVRSGHSPPICPVCRATMVEVEPMFPRLRAFFARAFDLDGPGWSLMRRSPR